MAKPTMEELQERFRYHAPTERAKALHELVNVRVLDLAEELVRFVPESRGLSVALTKLEECRMWANQAIATNHENLE